MGVSPYYRGNDCNFWALYDDNPHLVGATIHMLTKGLDSGPMLYHAMSNIKSNPFEYPWSIQLFKSYLVSNSISGVNKFWKGSIIDLIDKSSINFKVPKYNNE